MSWRRLFTFKGTAARSEYWAINLAGTVAFWLLLVFGMMLVVPFGEAAALSTVLALVPLVVILAVSVRRLHDRGRSGWWIILLGVVPGLFFLFGTIMSLAKVQPGPVAALFRLPGAVLTIWAFVELGCLPAKKGANKYASEDAAELSEAFS